MALCNDCHDSVKERFETHRLTPRATLLRRGNVAWSLKETRHTQKMVITMMFAATAAVACGSEKTGGATPAVTEGKCELADVQTPSAS